MTDREAKVLMVKLDDLGGKIDKCVAERDAAVAKVAQLQADLESTSKRVLSLGQHAKLLDEARAGAIADAIGRLEEGKAVAMTMQEAATLEWAIVQIRPFAKLEARDDE